MLPQGLLFPRNIHSCRIIDAPLQRNAKVAFIFPFHKVFLRVGVTKYCKLQCKMVRDHHAGSQEGSKASDPKPSETVQINLFGEMDAIQKLRCLGAWPLGEDLLG